LLCLASRSIPALVQARVTVNFPSSPPISAVYATAVASTAHAGQLHG